MSENMCGAKKMKIKRIRINNIAVTRNECNGMEFNVSRECNVMNK